jgi:hypothetical protein
MTRHTMAHAAKITIVDALRAPELFGGLPAFRDLTTWRSWIVLLSASYGLPLDPDEQAIFCRHTGRSTYAPPAGGWPEIFVIVGRQSGKTRIAATTAGFEAAIAPPEADATETYALLIAQDQRASLRTLFRYAVAPFEEQRVPLLARSVRTRLAGAVTLENGVVLAAYPCRPAAVRGLRARVVILDELAYYRNSEGYPTDVEMMRSVRSCLALTGGKLFVLSSPNAQTGVLYEARRRYYGRDDAPVVVWQASAPDMNPTLPRDYLERMRVDDPEAYRSEVLGEFRAGVCTFLDPDVIADAVAQGIRERAPEVGHQYASGTDVASGSGKDAFVTAIAHRDGARAVLDAFRVWRPPFNPSGAIAESADLQKRYGLRETFGDKYAPGFVLEGFRSQGIEYRVAERDTSATFLELLPLLNAGRVELLDQPELLRELRGLERRRGASGRDRVDHQPGAHNDQAVAVALALVQVAGVGERRGGQVVELLW